MLNGAGPPPTQSPSPLLEARHLGRLHPDRRHWLLQDISLAIPPGQRLMLAGPSGSGKTLLLRSLALLDPLDRGEILWQGQAVAHDAIPAFRSQVIYLHQRAALLEPTVEEALQKPFSLHVHRQRQFDRARLVRLLEQLGRGESFLGKQARDLSGGEIQITSLLRAIQLDPTILLLDEPTAALDVQTTEAVERLVDHWVGESPGHRSVVWVSHNPAQAERLGYATLRMYGGRLEEGGQRD